MLKQDWLNQKLEASLGNSIAKPQLKEKKKKEKTGDSQKKSKVKKVKERQLQLVMTSVSRLRKRSLVTSWIGLFLFKPLQALVVENTKYSWVHSAYQ